MREKKMNEQSQHLQMCAWDGEKPENDWVHMVGAKRMS